MPPSRRGGVVAGGRDGEPRLAIERLELENFKSYGGIVTIGPFHKSFSAIVGPNGSGKSNVIDAMLFVFGRRAKQLRHAKLSELLHHSASHPAPEYGTVTVYFHSIIDTGDGDDDYMVVENSNFSVARRAFRSDTSKYYLDGKEVKMHAVIDLFKSKGVDLDNNRFLILQGEVEQIAMMKPKALGAHDDGLLEYLEDIIGSHRHVAAIDAATAKVEALNEDRSHKLNRVKAVQRERDALEDAKVEAEAFLEREREVNTKKLKLAKAEIAEVRETLKEHTAIKNAAQAELEAATKGVKERESAVKELQATFDDTKKRTEAVAKDLNSAKEEYASFERKDIQLSEDIKALKASQKKLRESIEHEQKRAEDAEEEVKHHETERDRAHGALEGLETELTRADKVLEEVHCEVRETTAPIRRALEEKQRELLPYTDSVNRCTQSLEVKKSECELLVKKRDGPGLAIKEQEDALEALRADLLKAESTLADVTGKKERSNSELLDVTRKLSAIEKTLEDRRKISSDLRRRVEEARAASQDVTSRSRLHTELHEASASGRIAGIIGRLGDLASVHRKYDIAVGAAAGSRLESIVVRTTEAAQACIHLLRRENLGRATFIILEKVQHLNREIRKWSNSPNHADGQRLFDLLTIPNSENQVALYYALRDTLVAENLDEARRMAFKPTRHNKVVTMDGELIESSGAMTGGGRGPPKYRLGGKNTATVDPRETERMENELEQCMSRIRGMESELFELKQERQQLSRTDEQLDSAIAKANLDVESLHSRVKNIVEHSLPDLKCAQESAMQAWKNGDDKHFKNLQKEIKDGERKLAEAQQACEGLQGEVSKLQEEIVAAGGERMQKAKECVEKCRKNLADAKSSASKSASRAITAKKTAEKASKAYEDAKEVLENAMKEREEKLAQRAAMEDKAANVYSQYNKLEQVHDEWKEKLQSIQGEFSEVKEEMKKLRKVEVELEEKVSCAKRGFHACEQELKSIRKQKKKVEKEIERIRSDSLGLEEEMGEEVEDEGTKEDVIEEEDADLDEEMKDGEGDAEQKDDAKEDEEREVDGEEEVVLCSEEKNKLAREIAAIVSEMGGKKANVRAILDYRQKDREYKQQADELDQLTASRDAERKECDKLRKMRLDEFMQGFSAITLKLKELYQMITLGGDAELELVDSLDPFSEGIIFSVRPPKKSWKNISNLSGGEKTLSSLALVFALHHYKPTPLYFLDEIDAALDFKNVSIVANYLKERTKNAQFIVISLRNHMFEMADRLVGIYKTHHSTKSVTVNPKAFVVGHTQAQAQAQAQATAAIDASSS